MKILAKLLVAFLLVSLLCGIVGVVGVGQLAAMRQSLSTMASETVPTLDTLSSINLELVKIKAAIRSLSNSYGVEDPVFLQRQQDNIAVARKKYADLIERFDALPKVPEEQRLWDEIESLIPKVKPYTDEIISTAVLASETEYPAVRTGALTRLYAMISGDERLILDDFLAKVSVLIEFDRKYYAQEVPAKAEAEASMGVNLLVSVTILSFLFAIFLGIMLGNSISRSLRGAVTALDRIASGDTSARLEVRTKDEFKQVAASLSTVADTIDALIGEMMTLTEAAVAGRLSTRGELTKFQGGYRGIVEGVNQTLDAVIGPLNIAATYVDSIAKGDIPPKIEESYNGDFNLLKNNLNTCIDAIGALVADTKMLAQTAVEGNLSTRADATKHHGDFRRIVEGINRTLDLVIQPVNETIAILKKMSDGDMTTTMTGEYRGDFDVLKTSLNGTIESINDALLQVARSVSHVSASSDQVSQAGQSLSQGATEQASSLEQITSSVTEIAGQTKQNTENSVRVNSLAREAKQNAEQGDGQMKELVAAMSDINQSAEEIRKIVKTIDDISFQINLLALNANVEAARAGKYGKGFAVVAEEVRNLAVRSAGSVKETTGMVDMAIANIARGNELVEVTAKQLSSIVVGATQVASLAEEVSTASREQSQGLEQISTGLNQIDQVTQANTASAEESASASEELAGQAQQLKAMVEKFRLRENEEKMSEERMLEMLRARLAAERRVAHSQPTQPMKKVAEKKPSGVPRTLALRPADVVPLDDDDFGKF